jgi:hypothetical protein
MRLPLLQRPWQSTLQNLYKFDRQQQQIFTSIGYVAPHNADSGMFATTRFQGE